MTMSEGKEPDVLDVMVLGSGTYPSTTRPSDRSDHISKYALHTFVPNNFNELSYANFQGFEPVEMYVQDEFPWLR